MIYTAIKALLEKLQKSKQVQGRPLYKLMVSQALAHLDGSKVSGIETKYLVMYKALIEEHDCIIDIAIQVDVDCKKVYYMIDYTNEQGQAFITLTI